MLVGFVGEVCGGPIEAQPRPAQVLRFRSESDVPVRWVQAVAIVVSNEVSMKWTPGGTRMCGAPVVP